MARTPFIAGNWKMHKTVEEAEDYIQGLLPRVYSADGVDVAICVPFTALQAMVDSTRGSRVEVFAQNMHEADHGAFTGEVSAPMLTEIDVHGVVLGHSERRQHFNETDKALSQKMVTAFEHGLKPILCVGETEEERERGDTERKLRHQVQEGLERLTAEQIAEVTVAYEPIWAIGTGKVATPEQAQDAIAFVRALIGDKAPSAAPLARVLYGGSVDARQRARAARAARRRRRARRRRLAGARVVRAHRRCRGAGRRGVLVAASWRPRPRSASSSSTAGGWRRPVRATPSRSPTRRSSTRSGSATRTRR